MAFINHIAMTAFLIAGLQLPGQNLQHHNYSKTMTNMTDKNQGGWSTATFGGGCFWCIEAVFSRLNGVKSATSGFAGGHLEYPTYEQVVTGNTGHAEVVQIVYDPSELTYMQLLEVFFKVHDPTTLNRQGNDVGPQYRSVIFFHNEEQKNKAEQVIAALNKEGIWEHPIVTEVNPLDVFYPASDYHQNYFERNPHQAYCQMVISPKVNKFEQLFRGLLRE